METAILIMVIVAALFAMQIYLKRGIQGQLRDAATSIGEQYDPNATNSSFTVEHRSNTVSVTNTTPIVRDIENCPPYGGPCTHWTNAVITTTTVANTLYDVTNKFGTETVGGF